MPCGEDLNVGVGNRTGDTGLKYSMPGDSVRQKFTGYQKDNETQLDFAEARMYENRFGRFTAVDPLLASGRSANPQSFNRYAYCYNNPLKLVDKTGKWPTKVHWEMVREAFRGGLSESQIDSVIKGSNLVDTYFGTGYDIPITLFPELAYEHAMTPEGMSQDDAYKMSINFVSTQADIARDKMGAADDIASDSLVEFGKGTHMYMDSTSPEHSFKEYKIPKMTVMVPKFFTPHLLTFGDLSDDFPIGLPGVRYVRKEVIDFVQFAKELKQHSDGEKEPTPQQRQDAITLVQAYYLTTYGYKRFEKAVVNEEQREAVKKLLRVQGKTWKD